MTATLWGSALQREHTPSWVSSSQTGQCSVVKYCEIVPFLLATSPYATEEHEAFWICTYSKNMCMFIYNQTYCVVLENHFIMLNILKVLTILSLYYFKAKSNLWKDNKKESIWWRYMTLFINLQCITFVNINKLLLLWCCIDLQKRNDYAYEMRASKRVKMVENPRHSKTILCVHQYIDIYQLY